MAGPGIPDRMDGVGVAGRGWQARRGRKKGQQEAESCASIHSEHRRLLPFIPGVFTGRGRQREGLVAWGSGLGGVPVGEEEAPPAQAQPSSQAMCWCAWPQRNHDKKRICSYGISWHVGNHWHIFFKREEDFLRDSSPKVMKNWFLLKKKHQNPPHSNTLTGTERKCLARKPQRPTPRQNAKLLKAQHVRPAWGTLQSGG